MKQQNLVASGNIFASTRSDHSESRTPKRPFLVGQKAREEGAFSSLTRDHYLQPGSSPEELLHGKELQGLPFAEASAAWFAWRSNSFRGRTGETYQTFMQALERFFGGMRLSEITPTHLRQYQAVRQSNAGGIWKRSAGASVINHELNTLQQILRHAQLWAPLAPFYRPLPLPRWTPPRVMSAEESDRFYGLAGTRVEWQLACIVATLTVNTTVSGCELRGLQLMHVRMSGPEGPHIYVPSEAVKNEFRARVVPLNRSAYTLMSEALKRAAELGSVNPEHYLFPFRIKRNRYNPNRPASRFFLRAQFDKLRTAAGLPWLRPHDLRHQAITELLEAGTAEQTVMSIAGHVSKQMLDHYAHIRMPAKKEAVLAMEQMRMAPSSYRRGAQG